MPQAAELQSPPAEQTAYSTIVHATDFSRGGHSAFYHALRLSLASRGRLALVHVQAAPDLAGEEWSAFPRVRQTLAKWGLLEAGASEAMVAERLGLHIVKTDLAAAHPVETLVRCVDELQADLLVLGGQQREGLARVIHPSVSQPLARKAGVDALFVPDGTDGFVRGGTGTTHLHNVLIAVSHEPRPDTLIRAAVRMADLLGADCAFHILHVTDGAPPPSDSFTDDPRMRRMTRSGSVADTVNRAALGLGADLVVMGASRRAHPLGLTAGGKAEQVLRMSRRPLLRVNAA